MAEISEKSFPFDTEELDGFYDREYPADDFARYFRAFITSGIFMQEPTNLQVVANGDMTVTLKPGYMIIDGYRYDNTDDIVIPISAADGIQDRIDRISIMWSKEDRDIHYVIRKGTKSYNPVVPDLRRNEEYKDYIVADIYIKAGAIGITQANITDQRLNTTVCGLATPFVGIDLSTLAVQIQDFYEQTMKEVGEWRDDEEEALKTWVTTLKKEKTAQLQKLITDMENLKDDSAIEFSDWFTGNTNNWIEEFYSWFNNLKEQVTENAVINLQNQIGNLNELETEAKDSLTNAINEVHADIETTRTEIVADVEEKVDSIRVLNAEATITKPGPWMIEFTKINNRSTQMYEPKDGDIIIVRFAAPYQGGNFTSVRLTGFYRGGYPIEYLLNCYSTEVYTSPFEGATVNMGYRNSIILNVVFKGNAPYFLLLNDLPFAQTERYKKAVAYQFPQKNLFLQSGAISMYTELDNAINKRLKCVESGEFTNDTIALALGTGCTYLLATVEYTMSSKAIYGYRMCMIAVPQTGVNKAVSRANLVASTNAGVTLANVAPEDAGYVYREVTMKATSTYGVSYALYELDAYYTGDF